MGYCDITTYTGTAGVLGIIESIYGLGFTIHLLEVLFRTIIVSPRGNVINVDEYEFYIMAWNAVSGDAIKGLSVTATVLNSLWFLISIALLIAHPRRKVGWLWAWVAITSIIIIVDFCMTIGVAVIVVRGLTEVRQTHKYIANSLFVKAIAVVLLAFSRFGIVSFILNIYYTVSVSRRAKEIRLQDTQKMVFRQQFAPTVVGAPFSYAPITVGAVPPVPYGTTFMLQTYQPTPVQVPGLYPDFRVLPAQVNERVQPPDNPYLPPTAPHPQGHPGSDPSESFHKNHL